MKKLVKVFHFCRRHIKYTNGVFVILITLLIYYVSYALLNWDTYDSDPVFRFLDPLLGIFTAILALSIWYNEMVERWENSLPKRLNVHFIFKNQEVIFIKNAYLSSEADIRAWGQHLGGSLVKNYLLREKEGQNIELEKNFAERPYHLDFYPQIKENPRKLSEDLSFWQYEVFFFLERDEAHGNHLMRDCSPEKLETEDKFSVSPNRPNYNKDTNTVCESDTSAGDSDENNG